MSKKTHYYSAKKQAAREKRRQQKVRNRHVALLVAGVTLLVIVVVLILSAIPHYAPIVETEDGRFLDKDTGLYYLAAPSNYEPVSHSTKAYGKKDGHYFYPITGQQTRDWLTEDIYDICGVYYNETISLPSLVDFKANTIHVCKDGDAVVRVVEIADQADVQAVVNTMLNGEAVTLPDVITTVYTLRIASSEYTWLYYNVVYVVTAEGNFYYDRGVGKAVKADILVENYIKNAIEEGNGFATEEVSNDTADISEKTE